MVNNAINLGIESETYIPLKAPKYRHIHLLMLGKERNVLFYDSVWRVISRR